MVIPNSIVYRVAVKLRYLVNKLFVCAAEGMENLPNPPFIVVCNHVSIPDSWIISNAMVSQLGQPAWFIARDDFWMEKKWTRYIGPKLGAIVIDWRNPSKTLDQALKVVRNNGIVGIFPEATRNSNEKILLKGKTGAARLALWTGCAVVPAGYFGPPIATTWDAIKNFVLRRNLSKIVFGKPMRFKKINKEDITKEILHKTTNKIMLEIGKLCNKRPQLY